MGWEFYHGERGDVELRAESGDRRGFEQKGTKGTKEIRRGAEGRGFEQKGTKGIWGRRGIRVRVRAGVQNSGKLLV